MIGWANWPMPAGDGCWTIRTAVSASAIKSELYRVHIQALAERYPFDASSVSDVALTDFREFFAQSV
jgi:type VI protein secretion system component VasK